MIDVSLAAVPCQSFTIQLEGRFYEIAVREVGAGAMAATIVRDGESLVSSMRLTAGTPLLPYRYQESGNFLLLTEADALPDWAEFGVTQFLVYVTADELAAYREA